MMVQVVGGTEHGKQSIGDQRDVAGLFEIIGQNDKFIAAQARRRDVPGRRSNRFPEAQCISRLAIATRSSSPTSDRGCR